MPTLDHIRISAEVQAMMRCPVLANPDLETGGILLGEYAAPGTAIVKFATGPGPGASKTPSGVHFDARFLQTEQDGLMAEHRGLLFLGDWHYHPKGKGSPSRKDRRVLKELCRDADYQLEDRAFILIAHRRHEELHFRAFRLGRFRRAAEVPISLTPEHDANSPE